MCKHVFIVSREYPPNTVGGVGTLSFMLTTGLKREVNKVTVITLGLDSQLESEWMLGVNILKVKNRVIYENRTGLTPENMITHKKILTKIIEAVNS